jgi:hypothetical protein
MGLGMRYNDLLVTQHGNQYPAPADVAPYASLPSWWRRFIFQVLNPREFTVYMYLAMMTDVGNAVAYPLIASVQRDLGLQSDSAIFDALRELERLGFIQRSRQRLPNRTSQLKRNVYQRVAPEFTLIRLLEAANENHRRGKPGINGMLEPSIGQPRHSGDPNEITPVHRDAAAALKRLLGDESFSEYVAAVDSDKRDVLMRLLEERLQKRMKSGRDRRSERPPAPSPRDRQRENARKRELEIATNGGVAAAPPLGSEEEIPLDDFPNLTDEEIPF